MNDSPLYSPALFKLTRRGQQPASDIRYQFANVFRKLPLPVTKANYRSHVLATQLLLQIIDRKPHASDSNTELDAMSEVTSLWSNVEDNPNGEDMTEKLAAMDWAAVFKEQETLAANDERFIHRKDLPASTRQVVRTEKSHIFAGDSGKDVEAAHILANGPKNQILLFRTKVRSIVVACTPPIDACSLLQVDLTLASGTVDRLSFHLNHPSNVFCRESARTHSRSAAAQAYAAHTVAPGLHRALDRDMIAIVPEIDWLAEVVDQLNRENEIRLKRMDAGKPVGLLMLHVRVYHASSAPQSTDRPCWRRPSLSTGSRSTTGSATMSSRSIPLRVRLVRSSTTSTTSSTAPSDPTVSTAASDRRGRPLFYFSRLSPHWQHQPNPFLFVFNAAAKLAHHPDRPIPDAVRPNMLLCLEIVVRVFSTPSTLLPIAATQAHVKALAREQLKMARATATPAAAKKKW